jgi:hypothetical protein
MGDINQTGDYSVTGGINQTGDYTSSGTFEASTLTDGTATITGGALTGLTSVTTDDLTVSDDAQIDGDVNGVLYSTSKQHEEIGILLDILTDPRAIVGFTGTGADGSTEDGYESGDGREWTYSGGLATDKIFKGQTYVYSFDGVDSYLSTPDTADMSFGDGSDDSAFSIGGWVEVQELTSSRAIIGKWQSGTREWYLQLNAIETIQVGLADQSTNGYPERETDSPLSAGWHFVVATYDGTGGAGAASDPLGGTNCVIYVDGVAVASTSTTATYTAMENLGAMPMVGTILSTNFFDGKLGRLFVTAEELSAADVWKIYEKTRSFYNK